MDNKRRTTPSKPSPTARIVVELRLSLPAWRCGVAVVVAFVELRRKSTCGKLISLKTRTDSRAPYLFLDCSLGLLVPDTARGPSEDDAELDFLEAHRWLSSAGTGRRDARREKEKLPLECLREAISAEHLVFSPRDGAEGDKGGRSGRREKETKTVQASYSTRNARHGFAVHRLAPRQVGAAPSPALRQRHLPLPAGVGRAEDFGRQGQGQSISRAGRGCSAG